jgi:prevent-host-death family protein
MKKQTVPAGRFKAECLRLIDRVAETHESFIITKHGKPVVEVIPIQYRGSKPLRGSVVIQGDIVGPVLGTWDVE